MKEQRNFPTQQNNKKPTLKRTPVRKKRGKAQSPAGRKSNKTAATDSSSSSKRHNWTSDRHHTCSGSLGAPPTATGIAEGTGPMIPEPKVRNQCRMGRRSSCGRRSWPYTQHKHIAVVPYNHPSQALNPGTCHSLTMIIVNAVL